MRRLFACAALVAMCSGCMSDSDSEMTRFHDDGMAKPIVAILPVVDSSGEPHPWNLSEELTYSIYNRVAKRGMFWIESFAQNIRLAKQIPQSIDYFADDISWVKSHFQAHEFVVAVELIEHDIHLRPKSNVIIETFTPSCELEMAVRVRVFDVRGDVPKVILQEVISQTNMVSRPSQSTTSDKWKEKTFSISPMGFSHNQLSRDIVKRIEEYVTLAKSK